MRYPRCPHCVKGGLRTRQTITVDGITYRKKVCERCEQSVYTESRQITYAEWREAATYYEKQKCMERERRRESGS